MTQQDKVETISRMLEAAILSGRQQSPTEISYWLEQQSPNLRALLNAHPDKASGVHSALRRAVSAAEHWKKENKPCPLHQRLRPSARQLQAALRTD